ncbi:MAG TPA: hypothetical protein PKE27_19980 [Povalibacter sp.]|uniref:hypothetical protein n=1 Tax=Povalibacter sp. TaxID=1962978 RepID=UPI002B838DFB|nr:hypothetical protein [Povalibacter sp.]HMN46868.1 hypothetical protein [Povalibacter sp.]
MVLESRRFASPDLKHEATVEAVDNALGFGLGAIYDEVHVWVPGATFQHGDSDSTAVFYAESAYPEGVGPTVRWLNPHRLVIQYPEKNPPGRMKSEMLGISITYEAVPLEAYAAAQSASEP